MKLIEVIGVVLLVFSMINEATGKIPIWLSLILGSIAGTILIISEVLK